MFEEPEASAIIAFPLRENILKPFTHRSLDVDKRILQLIVFEALLNELMKFCCVCVWQSSCDTQPFYNWNNGDLSVGMFARA